MEYQGLTQDDLENVAALNRSWLDLHVGAGAGPSRLTPAKRDRLAGAPFLLFSYREQDEPLWQRLLSDGRQPDLLRAPAQDASHELQATGLAFLWELARRNPYAARVVSIAPLHWCERIASSTLVRLMECAAGEELVEARLPASTPMQRRLFLRGAGARRDARKAAQIATLQSLLTVGETARYGRLPAAACRLSRPSRQVADKV